MSAQITFPSLEELRSLRARICTANRFAFGVFLFLSCNAVMGGLAVAQSPPVVTAPNPAPNLRAIPDDNLAYPVFVGIGNGSGSGFYLTVGKEMFFVTAKHVLFDPTTNQLHGPIATLVSYSKDLTDATRNIVILNLSVLQADKDLIPHPSQDVVVVKVFDDETLI